MNRSNGRDWRDLCGAAAKELDSDKLFGLVRQILEALDENDSKLMRHNPDTCQA